MPKRKTPPEKKVLSYAKDRRNDYGESDKGSRTSIKRNKTNPTRAYRRQINQILQSDNVESDVEGVEAVDVAVKSIKRRKWRKSPDTPLGEFVKRKLEKRIKSVGAKLRRREMFFRRTGENT